MTKIIILISTLMMFSLNTTAKEVGHTKDNSKYVIMINNKKIYKEQYDTMKKIVTMQLYRTMGGHLNEFVLEKLIEEELLLEFAKKSNLTVSEKEVNNFIENIEYFQEDGKFDKVLYIQIISNFNFEEKEYKKYIKNILLMEKVANLLAPYLSVSDEDIKMFSEKNQETKISYMKFFPKQDEIKVNSKEVNNYIKKNKKLIKEYFIKHKRKFSHEDEVEANHILIKTTKGKDDSKALKRINELRNKIIKGAKFSEIATKYSECPSAKKGGALGYFSKGRMVKPFEETAFKLKVNEVSKPVKTRFGYHLIIITNKRKAFNSKLKDVEFSIAEDMLKKEKRKNFMKTLNKTLEENIKKVKTISELNKLMPKYKVNTVKNIKINSYYIRNLGSSKTLVKDLFKEDIKSGEIIKKIYKVGSSLVVVQSDRDTTAKGIKVEKEKFRKKLKEQKISYFMETWFTKQRRNADIKINPDYLK